MAKVIGEIIFHCFWVIWKIRRLFFGWPECSSLVEQKHRAGSSQRAGFWLVDRVDAGDWLARACWWMVHCSCVIYAGIISICHSLMWKTNRTCGYRSCHLSAGTRGERTDGLLPSCAVNSSMSLFHDYQRLWQNTIIAARILITDCQISSVNLIFKKDHVYQCANGKLYKNTNTHMYIFIIYINYITNTI